MNITFDSAAKLYDKTREFPRNVERAFVTQLSDVFGDPSSASILEIGAGTGRIAIPLSQEYGFSICCVDISEVMLEKLRAKAASLPIECIVADGTHLPFESPLFTGVILCAVLHVVKDWRQVLSEADRVMRKPGQIMLMLGRNYREDTPTRELLRELRRLRELPPTNMPLLDDIRAYLKNKDYSYRTFPSVHATLVETPRVALANIENEAYPHTWGIPERERTDTLSALKGWAQSRWINLDQSISSDVYWQWHCFATEDCDVW